MQLRFDAANAPGLSERVRERTIKLAGQRATKDGVIVIEAGRFRTQEQNRADARRTADGARRQGGRTAAAAAQEDQADQGFGRTAAEEQGRALDGQEAARQGRRRLKPLHMTGNGGFRVAVLRFGWHSGRTIQPELQMTMLVLPKGVRHMPGYLAARRRRRWSKSIREVVEAAPLYMPAMPKTGKEMSVRMTNCGALGWVTDKERGYRYQPTHPVTGAAVAADPGGAAATLARGLRLSASAARPAWSISTPTTAQDGPAPGPRRAGSSPPPSFRSRWATTACSASAGRSASAPTVSFRLESGDVVVLGGEGRLAFHGVDRIYPATSTLLKNGGRINLTLRRVTEAGVRTPALTASSAPLPRPDDPAPFRRMRSARGRVGRMFSRRFFRLMLAHSPSAMARAASFATAANSGGRRSRDCGTRSRAAA